MTTPAYQLCECGKPLVYITGGEFDEQLLVCEECDL